LWFGFASAAVGIWFVVGERVISGRGVRDDTTAYIVLIVLLGVVTWRATRAEPWALVTSALLGIAAMGLGAFTIVLLIVPPAADVASLVTIAVPPLLAGVAFLVGSIGGFRTGRG
jgi:hypothetical protein